MRVTHDVQADAAYIYLTADPLPSGRDTVPCDSPAGTNAMVFLDWRVGKIVGLEVLGASTILHADLLAQAG